MLSIGSVAPYHVIENKSLSVSDLMEIIQSRKPVLLSEEISNKIVRCREYLDNKITRDESALYYGVNTGFGYLQQVGINKEEIQKLQFNLLQSHACGTGEKVPLELVKLMLLTKIYSLSQGYSGVQLDTLHRLIDFYNNDILPVVYTQGSLGASGDLAPLSHLSLPVIGLGEVSFQGKTYSTEVVLKKFGWKPITLQSKEGLSLINGTQFMLAYGMHCIYHAQRLFDWADLIAAISLEAFNCNVQPFHPLIHEIRPHEGQLATAKTINKYLKGSQITQAKGKQVQDPYSFRCIPQVHGASRDTLGFVQKTFEIEINSVTDNPNIFPEEDQILAGGNFHGQPLALGFDFLAIAMAEMGSISERRTYQLLTGKRGLPLFLVDDPGLHSGLMIPQYTAASVVSENKQLCTPASVDSIVSSNGQEDHVSMGANGATKCLRVLQNLEKILAIELLTSAQALEFRKPVKSSAVVEKVVDLFRKEVEFTKQDKVLAPEIQKSIDFLQKVELSSLISS
ncbi:histidine ammonia-lyase [Echinicola jeungdonensis]|uniref:Histidine ammonia-lyase n=1 Tax=Echinicola jeungdonensis TaxID=709343 RepID=A0ABV5J6C9_9BACT|nr:histidine ammonia-lyase [Echinicola jeungdonensis]MDN3669821.1 histidine ammonia-lyase [Echinicola jeungdonensis]